MRQNGAKLPTDFDISPVTMRGPLITNNQHMARKARIFTHDNRLYIAESRTNGRTVASVTSYPLPDGEPENRKARAGSLSGSRWGDWSWSSCGCATNWKRHSKQSLIDIAKRAEDI